MNWKLLGDLMPSELRLECERAGIAPSVKDSHNFIRLSKYIMSNGYDPETFFFNTIYQADKTNPLVGMTPGAVSPSSTQVKPQEATKSPLQAKMTNPIRFDSTSKNSILHPPDENMEKLLGLCSTMSENIKKLVTLMEEKQMSNVNSDLEEYGSEEDDATMGMDGSLYGSYGTPSWYSFGSNSVSSSSKSSTGHSRFKNGRRYDREMLISDNICLSYQHGRCSYGDDYHGLHSSEHGQDVLHYCGLCWTDSPDNQCYDPAYKCRGPYFNS